MKDNAILFALSSNQTLAKKVSNLAKIKLGKVEIEHFADGEILARTLENVSGKRCFVIQSTNSPASQHIFELLVFIDSLKTNGAKEIVLVMPYYGYSRQDRVARPGEPITAKMVASLYQAVGADSIISVDLHTPQIQGFFSCPVKEISTTELFANYFNEKFEKEGIATSDVVVVAPDHGSALRARDLGSMFDGASIAFIDKRRPAPNKSEVINLVGNVRDKVCIIIDDIIDTGMTVNNAASTIHAYGAKDIFVCASHAILSENTFLPIIHEVVVTDTVEKNLPNIKVLSIAPLIAKAIEEML